MACQTLWLCLRHTWNCAQFPVIVQSHLIWVISHIFFFVFNYPIFGVAHSKWSELWQCAKFLAILNHEFQWIIQKRQNTNESHQLKSWPRRKRETGVRRLTTQIVTWSPIKSICNKKARLNYELECIHGATVSQSASHSFSQR